MIQDIYPHRFYNEYRTDAVCRPGSRILCFDGGKILLKYADGSVPERTGGPLTYPEETKLPRGTYAYPVLADLPSERPEPVYAFCVDETEYFLDISGSVYDLKGFQYIDVRELRLVLDNVNGMVIFTGDHLHQWYSQSRFCGRCAARTIVDDTERVMACPSCGHRIYPRLQPAVIVGVINKDRLLMTKYQAGFKYYALVAGFAEIGETLEETVQREVMEETGLKIRNILYYKSQPWGIAQDVLCGFYCEVDGSDEIRLDENELKLAEWKRRDEIELHPDSYSLTNEMMRAFKEGEIR